MREEYNSVMSTPTETDTNISVKPKYRPIIGLSLFWVQSRFQNICRCTWSNYKTSRSMQCSEPMPI